MLVADTSVLLRRPVLPVYSSYPLHTPILVSQWKAKKTQPRLFANLVVATNYTATVHHDRNQQPARVSLVLSAHRGPPMGVHFRFRHLRPLKYHLKFLHTFALKIPIENHRCPNESAWLQASMRVCSWETSAERAAAMKERA